jgi:aryl-alcohol dehydrogenase-like predicted oxidoreductase
MRLKKLGNTGLLVSEICLGTMTFGNKGGPFAAVGQLQQNEVDGIVRTAFDSGVNFLDTADVYHGGQSETMTGQAIRNLGVARDQFVLATKVFGRMGPGPNQSGLSRARILRAVDESLKRLQMDYIDLYQIHGYDPLTPLEETLEALDTCVRTGKVRYIGLCNLPAWMITKALWISDRKQLARFESVQAYYSIAGRELEREIVPLAKGRRAHGAPLSIFLPSIGSARSTSSTQCVRSPKRATPRWRESHCHGSYTSRM